MKTDKILNYLFYFSVLVFFIGFNFRDNPPSGWYLQTMPELEGRQIKDITFIDSLTGYAVGYSSTDTNYIMKTTNGGYNWGVIFRSYTLINKVKFTSFNTGYIAGSSLYKTTNQGQNFFWINKPAIQIEDLALNGEDTIWIISSDPLTGGVFRTTNGGQSWIQQLSAGNQNPDKIYMYNARIGFIGRGTSYSLRKTTDGGFNWFSVLNEGFNDIYFIDSLTGWSCFNLDSIKKTTNGGYNWFKILLPPTGGFYNQSTIRKFSVINNDTIYGVGARAYTTNGIRGLIYKTTNGGINWGYQLPDPNQIDIFTYYHLKFISYLTGWTYATTSGIHTITGGDTTIYTGIENKIISEMPKEFELNQNYPNPFNQTSIINVQCSIGGEVKLKVYNINGKEVKILIDEYKQAGTYSVRFDAGDLPSGIYFYSLLLGGKVVDTKKATLIK